MGRVHQKLFRINDQIAALDRERALAVEELGYHRHLDDDAQRDAAVSGSPFDRADARETSGDVARFESVIRGIDEQRARLAAKRDRLLRKL